MMDEFLASYTSPQPFRPASSVLDVTPPSRHNEFTNTTSDSTQSYQQQQPHLLQPLSLVVSTPTSASARMPYSSRALQKEHIDDFHTSYAAAGVSRTNSIVPG